MQFQLEEKVALVTGGSEGIGRATALAFAQHGARVVIAARRPEVLAATAQELRKAGARVLPVAADVTIAADVERLIHATVSEFGGLDILVNNAGTGRAGHFEAVDEATWDADLDVKLRAAIRTTRAALPHLKQRGGGRIVNVTTPGGKQPGGNPCPPLSVARRASR